ncbi:MAG: hypothetical protein K6F06_09900 [Bacteroidales bacterium]|nr:hypothetical protein [Bacteroidales bacterium]
MQKRSNYVAPVMKVHSTVPEGAVCTYSIKYPLGDTATHGGEYDSDSAWGNTPGKRYQGTTTEIWN